MIVQKAYKGRNFVYRAYKGEQLIWDYGSYTAGSLIAALIANAMPQTETPDDIRMDTSGTTVGTGLVRTVTPHLLAHAIVGASVNTIPRAREAVHSAALVKCVWQTLGIADAYGVVWTRGHADVETTAIAMPHAVDTVYGRGPADVAVVGRAMPTMESLRRLIVAATGEIQGWTIPQMQDSERVLMGTATETAGSGCPTTLPAHTVTFMHNGVVLHRASVVDGYDCTDPVDTGELEAPIKEMTVSHTYTHSGWSRTEGGEADSDALANITEDVVVYATFEESIRYYNIKFYDEGKLLDTVPFAYGETPAYTAVKTGYISSGWNPVPTPVTGEASYTAVWKEISAFADASWDEIAMISESGKAAECFALGDTKPITFTSYDGTTMTANMEIVGFNHDDLADGSGKAGISMIVRAIPFAAAWDDGGTGRANWGTCRLSTVFLNGTFLKSLDEDLQAVIKTVSKKYAYYNGSSASILTASNKVWIPSVDETGCSTNVANYHGSTYLGGDGEAYANFALRRGVSNGSGHYFLRSGSAKSRSSVWRYSIATTYAVSSALNFGVGMSKYYVVFGFCV